VLSLLLGKCVPAVRGCHGLVCGLPEAERSQVPGRFQEARSLMGPVDALAQLKQWKAPQER
jgi:hypothetical protein